jgi:hypothetical protein
MSFLGEPFKHDLFVSYSHGDFDRPGDPKLKAWSQAFIRALPDGSAGRPSSEICAVLTLWLLKACGLWRPRRWSSFDVELAGQASGQRGGANCSEIASVSEGY